MEDENTLKLYVLREQNLWYCIKIRRNPVSIVDRCLFSFWAVHLTFLIGHEKVFDFNVILFQLHLRFCQMLDTILLLFR